jgi:phage-related protein
MRTIIFYRTRAGRSPITEFLDGLDSKQAQKVVWVLKLVEELDIVPTQYFKKLVNSDGIWEVRIQYGGNIFRLLGFLDGERFVVLTNGFAKKTQKTPLEEIRLAETRQRDYLEQKR